jgi:hypothetical protein
LSRRTNSCAINMCSRAGDGIGGEGESVLRLPLVTVSETVSTTWVFLALT